MRVCNGQNVVTIQSDGVPVEQIERESGKPVEWVEVERDLQDVSEINGGVLQTPPQSDRTRIEDGPRLPLETCLVGDRLHNTSHVRLLMDGRPPAVTVYSKPDVALSRRTAPRGLCLRVSAWCLNCWHAFFGQRTSEK